MIRSEVVDRANNWNVCDEYKDMTMDELKEISLKNSLPFAVCAFNVTGELNLGIMMRTACLMGARRFMIYGNPKYDKRTTVGSHNYIDVLTIDTRIFAKSSALVEDSTPNLNGPMKKQVREIDYSNFHSEMNKLNYRPIFFDTGGIDIKTFICQYSQDKSSMNGSQSGLKIPCLVFGNEGMGIPKEITEGHDIITIPQRGVLRSLNVSAAASIVMHEFSSMLQ